MDDRFGPKRGRGRGFVGLGSRPRGPSPRGPMMGMRPQMMRPNQPFGQGRPRMQPMRPNFEGAPPMNFEGGPPMNFNQNPQRGSFRGRGMNRPMKRPAENRNENKRPKKLKAAEPMQEITMQIIPKDAMSCLNAIECNVDKSISFRSSNDNVTNCCIASIMFQNKQIHGYGATDKLATQVVAENALRTLVENPCPTEEFSADKVKEQDLNIWKSIVSYSLYKMFHDWNDERVGLQPRDNWLVSSGMLSLPKTKKKEDSTSPMLSQETLNAYARKLPANPETFHPSVLLNSIEPGLQFEKTGLSTGQYRISAVIQGKEYIGEAINIKLARACLAYKAIKDILNIECKLPAQIKLDV